MDVSKMKLGLDPALDSETQMGAGEAQKSPDSQENGPELLEEVASLTGLPVEWVQNELAQIVKNSGHTPEQLTLEELRASMIQYLEEMNQEWLAQEKADLDLLDSMALPSDLSH